MTAEERADEGLHEEKKMEAPGWFNSVISRRSFGLGKAGLGCGRVGEVVWEEDRDAGRIGRGEGVGSDGAADMASGVGSGAGDWFFIVQELNYKDPVR